MTIPSGSEEVIGKVTDIYTGAFYALNPNCPDVLSDNCFDNINNCTNNIDDFYNLHIASGLPENELWGQIEI